MKKAKIKLQFPWLFYIVLAYAALMLIVLSERAGIRFTNAAKTSSYLDPASITLETADLPLTTLLLYDSTQPESTAQREQWHTILQEMDVGYAEQDVAQTPLAPLQGYDKAIVTFPELDVIGGEMDLMTQWVKEGGGVLFSATLADCSTLRGIGHRIGIYDSSYESTATEKIAVDGFMVGGNRSYAVPDPFESSLRVQLTEEATAHIMSAEDNPNPILWQTPYGEGRFVVVNLGFLEKSVRGIYAAAYSLLGDACVYPVINSATFYIDDFPSPVPGGNGAFVQRDYQRDIASFYTNVWWPDMQTMTKTYGARYTAVIIENYEDETTAPFARQTDVDRFHFFGKSVLLDGGELGYHGYNHQPLVLESFDYRGEENYAKWPDTATMQAAVTELRDFCAEAFPTVKLSVYVPPSNILSAEGRAVLAQSLPDLCGVASLYFSTGVGYGQEFTVAQDGIVEMPRIVSGCELTDYMWLAAFSELNFHYLASHFLHPDDLLDPDRGAEQGWPVLKEKLKEYVAYVAQNTPQLRMQVGSEEAGAVQRYCYAQVRSETTADAITVNIGNFFDEAYCFVRLNEGVPGAVQGGTLEPIADGLYLLHATQAQVKIERGAA